jgi:hypothetical protein
MPANRRDDPPIAETPLFGDQETATASGVPLPSLRVLQAAGAIRSEKAPKYHGGFRRMWPEQDVLKAALAAALGEHFAWNIRLVAAAMAKVQPALWNILIEVALTQTEKGDPKNPKPTLLVASELDWRVELIDRKFLFFQIPELFTDALPGAAAGQTSLLLGMVAKDTFVGISWELATPRGRKLAKEALGDEGARNAMLMYRLAMASNGNFLSKATINLSLQVRAAWRRLHGLESRFLQETVQLGRSQPDQ